MKVTQSCLTLQLHGLYSPCNSPGQNTWVGSGSLLQWIFPNPGIEPRCPTLRADSLPAEPQGKPPWQWRSWQHILPMAFCCSSRKLPPGGAAPLGFQVMWNPIGSHWHLFPPLPSSPIPLFFFFSLLLTKQAVPEWLSTSMKVLAIHLPKRSLLQVEESNSLWHAPLGYPLIPGSTPSHGHLFYPLPSCAPRPFSLFILPLKNCLCMVVSLSLKDVATQHLYGFIIY